MRVAPQPGTVKRTKDVSNGLSAEVRKIVKELQETTAQRYLVIRTARYENLLRSAPVTYAGARGHLLAFSGELVLYVRAGAANRASSNTASGSAGITRLEYKDIAEIQASGNRLTIQLHAADRDSGPLDISQPATPVGDRYRPYHLLQANTIPTPAPSPSTNPGRGRILAQAWLDRVRDGFSALVQSRPCTPMQPTPRAGPPPGARGRRMSRMESDFGQTALEASAAGMLSVDLESALMCSQMQVRYLPPLFFVAGTFTSLNV